MRDDRADAALSCRITVCLRVGALVCHYRPGRDVRPDVEERLELATVAGLTAGQVEVERQAFEVALQVDLGAEAAT